MDASELIKKVRRIEIKTRGLTRQIFAGEYHSAFKGKGMAFSEVREYQYGDDIRNIDWNVTARFSHPFIKIFEEERELTVMLLVDVSGSGDFASRSKLKRSLITEISAVLAFSAISNNDKIGAVLFSDIIEKFIPPKKGRQHTLRIIREVLDYSPKSKGTDISVALRYFTNVIKKRSTAFLISDMMDEGFDDPLKLASRKHDLVALKIYDTRESELPDVGLISMKDAESGKMVWVDSGNAAVRERYKKFWMERNKKVDESLKRQGVDFVSIGTHEDFVKPLMQLFKKRA